MVKCISAFGWKENELIGNKTLKELLISDVDIRSEKMNLKKVDVVVEQDHVTLLELAELVIQGKVQNVKLPQYIVEESNILPRIKPRFYSIINDPFVENAEKTKRLTFLFSETSFTKNDSTRFGLCSSFLKSSYSQEIKCQFSQAYRVLKMPEFKKSKLIMIA